MSVFQKPIDPSGSLRPPSHTTLLPSNRSLAETHKVRKTMPRAFSSPSKYRMLSSKRWQTYHRDWHMEYGRDLYKSHNSHVFALINLFEYDNVFVSDPESVEMKVTGEQSISN